MKPCVKICRNVRVHLFLAGFVCLWITACSFTLAMPPPSSDFGPVDAPAEGAVRAEATGTMGLMLFGPLAGGGTAQVSYGATDQLALQVHGGYMELALEEGVRIDSRPINPDMGLVTGGVGVVVATAPRNWRLAAGVGGDYMRALPLGADLSAMAVSGAVGAVLFDDFWGAFMSGRASYVVPLGTHSVEWTSPDDVTEKGALTSTFWSRISMGLTHRPFHGYSGWASYGFQVGNSKTDRIAGWSHGLGLRKEW
jgi:hypothetical protein